MKSADDDDDGGLTRMEFVKLCTRLLPSIPIERLEMAASNHASAVEQEQMYYARQWRKVANKIEALARHSSRTGGRTLE